MSTKLTPPIEKLIEQVKQATELGSSYVIEGHATKSAIWKPEKGDLLSTKALNQVVEYDPSELVVTVQAGVSIVALEALLAESGQRLSFEPPLYAGQSPENKGTVGGMIASGLAGPRRPWSGGVRDSVLGLHLISGRGEYLRFGGQVMKNVAGYDVSRLMVGAMGCLGLITQVSLKVQPLPQGVSCYSWACSTTELLDRYAGWQRSMNPISGLAHDGSRAYLRLEGGLDSCSLFASRNDLTRCTGIKNNGDFWAGLRNHSLPFFEGDLPLWRLSVPPLTDLASVLESHSVSYLMDWAGAQYWVRAEQTDFLRQLVTQHGGSFCSYSCTNESDLNVAGSARGSVALGDMNGSILLIHQRLKSAYDPNGVFNVGALHESF